MGNEANDHPTGGAHFPIVARPRVLGVRVLAPWGQQSFPELEPTDGDKGRADGEITTPGVDDSALYELLGEKDNLAPTGGRDESAAAPALLDLRLRYACVPEQARWAEGAKWPWDDAWWNEQ